MIPAHPLQWPVGWKRTQPSYRTRAKFSKARQHHGDRYVPARDLTISEGTQRVLEQLQRMGLGREDVVISTNLRLRLDGLPRRDQGEPADPGVAVYWQDAAQGHKVMAIDIYDRVADNLAAVAATLDAMRAIERHGGATVLERAYTGFTALPAPAPRTWREVFGYGPQAVVSTAMLEVRFRQLASEHHPDKGGDPKKMVELNAARDEARKEVGNA